MMNRFSPVPEGFHTVTPYLMVSDVDTLVEFMSHAFGAEEVFRARGARGGLHVEVRVGDSMVMIGDLQGGDPQPAAIFLYIDGVDEVYRRALEAASSRIVVTGGEASRAQPHLAYQAGVALAERLGTMVVYFPGGHGGFSTHPGAFAERLHKVLRGG